MENKMCKVAELLGVKMGEQFRIKDGFDNISYVLNEKGLFAYVEKSPFHNEPFAAPFVLIQLLCGEIEVKK